MPSVRPHLRDLVRVDSADIRGDFVRLDRNERISPLPDDIFRAIMATFGPQMMSSYPDPKPLIEAFAEANGLPPDHVVATNGSDSAIRRVFHSFVAPGDKVAMSHPTYAMYAVYSHIAGAETIERQYAADRTLDGKEWLSAIEAGARLICIVNPDNPTAAVLPREELLGIVAAAAKRDVLCLVDETYYPCHPETIIDAVKTYPNLIVTRSLSKLFGLGGLRIGFACGQPALIDGVGKTRGLHEVNTLAIHAGCYMLRHPELVDRFIKELEDGRAVLSKFARGHNFGLPPCPTNYQLIELPDIYRTDDVVQALSRRGFLVKAGFKSPGLRQCLRVTLDGHDLMQRFVDTFALVLSEDVVVVASGAN
jgi:histidinol-phosphate aminotransferase